MFNNINYKYETAQKKLFTHKSKLSVYTAEKHKTGVSDVLVHEQGESSDTLDG